MDTADPNPGWHAFALRLQPTGTPQQPLRGQLEHVMSGRCHDFETAEQLLAWLARERAQLAPPAAGEPGASGQAAASRDATR
jgi:hypothetical protein